MINQLIGNKLQPVHLERAAMVYLRQSSLSQVKHNVESQRLQYALAQRAKDLGFLRVEVIDCDLGVSAAVGSQRPGFKQLLAAVAMGDEETIYDPSNFDDQLVLGIKGTLSVAELNVLKLHFGPCDYGDRGRRFFLALRALQPALDGASPRIVNTFQPAK